MTTETRDRWLDNLLSRGQKPAVIQFQKKEFSYEDLSRQADWFAAGLRERGIKLAMLVE